MSKSGFDLVPGEHPIIPIMLGDAKVASTLARRLQEEGVYVVAFSFPVVPRGKARIRTQMNAAHRTEQLDLVIAAFRRVAAELQILQ